MCRYLASIKGAYFPPILSFRSQSPSLLWILGQDPPTPLAHIACHLSTPSVSLRPIVFHNHLFASDRPLAQQPRTNKDV